MSENRMDNRSFMIRTAEGIVRLRSLFLVVFAALIVFSCFSISWVNVENDITAYLQDSAESKRGITIMNEEFRTYATADIMVENVDEKEAQRIADLLAETEGVTLVNYDGSAKHFRDNKALYNITFSGTASDQAAIDGAARVKDALGAYTYSFHSDSFSTLNEIIVTEMAGVLVIVVIVVVAVLLFTSSTYAEVLVFLATFLTSAIINMGTNFFMGTISFVSNAVAVVLQLALSVDYAIILCNRYKEEHEKLPIREAVVSALSHSIPEISASSLTTVAGLLAMTFMEFRLGLDMGVALIKAIVCSLLTVFLFMPAMLMLLGRLMDKTRHKSFVPKISFAGKFAYLTRFVIPPLFLALVIFAYLGLGQTRYGYAMSVIENAHKNEEDLAKAEIEASFGKNNLIAVMVPSGDYEKEMALADRYAACPEINSVLSLAGLEAMDGYRLGDSVDMREFMELSGVDRITAQALFAYYAAGQDDLAAVTDDIASYRAPLLDLFLSIHDLLESDAASSVEIPQEQAELVESLYARLHMAQEQLQGENYSRMLVYVDLPEQGDETFDFLDKMHVLAAQYYPEGAVMTGNAVSANDFNNSFRKDYTTVTVLSLVLVMLILLLTFRSVGMPLLLILVIQGSIWLNFAIPAWQGKYVFFMCFLIVTAIQMGANIDYAIVISSRYISLRDAGRDRRDAIVETLNLAFPTVITSGTMMVAAGLLIGARVSQCVIAGMGYYVGTGTAISLLFVNFALPQILVLGDGFIRGTTLRAAGEKLRSFLRPVLATALAAAAIFSVVFGARLLQNAEDELNEKLAQNETISAQVAELHKLAVEMSLDKESYDEAKLSFATHLVTDSVGGEQLAEGEEKIAEGEQSLDAAKATYASGEAQYEAGLAQYEAGLAQYEAGKAAYAEAEQQLAVGQAAYDEGLAQLNAAKEQYAAGEARLNAIQPVYNLIMPLYSRYQQIQSRYDEAVAAGDLVTAAILAVQVEAARAAFETQLGSTGYSLAQIVSEYQAGQQALADGAAQIAEAEQQLAAGKQQLDDGYAQLAEAKQKLDEAEAQLAAGKQALDYARQQLAEGAAQIADGENQLNAGKDALAEGRETLEENRAQLAEDMSFLNDYTDKNERLKAGLDALMRDSRIAGIAGGGATVAEVCDAAELLLAEESAELKAELPMLRLVYVLLALSAVLAVLALALLILGVHRAAAVLLALSLVAAIAGLLACRLRTPSFAWMPLLFLALALLDAAMVGLLTKKRHSAENA